jgi:hypothetical protein
MIILRLYAFRRENLLDEFRLSALKNFAIIVTLSLYHALPPKFYLYLGDALGTPLLLDCFATPFTLLSYAKQH